MSWKVTRTLTTALSEFQQYNCAHSHISIQPSAADQTSNCRHRPIDGPGKVLKLIRP